MKAFFKAIFVTVIAAMIVLITLAIGWALYLGSFILAPIVIVAFIAAILFYGDDDE